MRHGGVDPKSPDAIVAIAGGYGLESYRSATRKVYEEAALWAIRRRNPGIQCDSPAAGGHVPIFRGIKGFHGGCAVHGIRKALSDFPALHEPGLFSAAAAAVASRPLE